MPDKRPAIPLPIKREIRQRCGYGCVICGLPLYEYDHIEEWSKIKEHDPNKITLLCNKHHAEKTKGLLTAKEVSKANDEPINLRKGISSPYSFHFSGDTAEFLIGNNHFISIPDSYGTGIGIMPIVIDNIPVIGFRIIENHLFLDLQLYDECNEKIIEIKENELIYNVNQWDIEFVGRTLKIRKDKGVIIFEIQFNPPGNILIPQAKIFFNGVLVNVDQEKICIENNKNCFSNCTVKNVPYGIVIGDDSRLQRMKEIDIAFGITGVNRYFNLIERN